jgi:hypothetical protein
LRFAVAAEIIRFAHAFALGLSRQAASRVIEKAPALAPA